MHPDISAYDYDLNGQQYYRHRRADPQIAARIEEALGDAATVLNVGAGAGSYEPQDRYVIAVEPSASMRAQRLAQGKLPALNGTAESLPFDEGSFEASMATLTIHHWPDLEAGLREMRRVTRGPVVLMSYDPEALDIFWNQRYFPELVRVEQARYPSIDRVRKALGGQVTVSPVSIPLHCTDGFQEAFYGRPEAFLQPEVRRAQSAWGFLPEGLEPELVSRLEQDLSSGVWDRDYGHLRTQAQFAGALRLIVGMP